MHGSIFPGPPAGMPAVPGQRCKIGPLNVHKGQPGAASDQERAQQQDDDLVRQGVAGGHHQPARSLVAHRAEK